MNYSESLSQIGCKEYLSDHARVMIDNNDVIIHIEPDSYCKGCTLKETINNYVLDEVEYFRNTNHVSKRAWKKRGVIELDDHKPEYFQYLLIYETRFKRRYQKIKFSYGVVKTF